MKVLINIPEKVVTAIQNGEDYRYDIHTAIATGTPLPKGHGDLIDRKDLIETGISKGFCDWYDEIKMADTIIEADKETDNETRM